MCNEALRGGGGGLDVYLGGRGGGGDDPINTHERTFICLN